MGRKNVEEIIFRKINIFRSNYVIFIEFKMIILVGVCL